MAAQAIVELIDRKVVKQTVMTSVYGVTFIGARQQLQVRVREGRAERAQRGGVGFDDDIQNGYPSNYNASGRIGNLRYA
jgi:hypothetical protein